MSLNWTIKELVEATNGELLSNPIVEANGVGTDTRDDLSGKIFIALKGDRFDAHDFLPKAVLAGASVLIVHRELDSLPNYYKDVTVLKVDDTLKALQDMAVYWRKNLDAQVIGLTGSAGKTTTKEFLKALLSSKFNTFASEGSFNNHWGVPLTILACPKDAEKLIVEIGMNAPGEIRDLCQIARPDAVMVTMVGSAHIGQFNSQQEIAEAKEEIYESCPKAISVFNLDNSYTLDMYERRKDDILPERLFTFSGFNEKADVKMRITRMELGSIQVRGVVAGESSEVKVPVFGRHNVVNLMAAASMALAAGMSGTEVWASLGRCRTSWGRGQMVDLKCGAKALFDAYNANPESMAALVRSLFETQVVGKKVAVLGEMLELGDVAPEAHRKLGELAGNTDLELVWFIGEHHEDFRAGIEATGFSKTSYFSDSYEQSLAIKIGSMLNQEDIVVLKGSRGMKLERVLQNWEPLNF